MTERVLTQRELNIQASHLRFVGLHFRGHYACWGVLVAGVRGLVFEDCVGEPQRFGRLRRRRHGPRK